MKKIIILIAVLLLGVGSVFAQGAWEVRADWFFDQDSECDDLLSNQYGFLVKLYIYDDANSNEVTDPNTVEAVDWNVNTFTFPGSKTKVQAYCNEYHDYTPSFSVDVTVYIVLLSNITTPICTTYEYTSSWTCTEFGNGDVLLEEIIFY